MAGKFFGEIKSQLTARHRLFAAKHIDRFQFAVLAGFTVGVIMILAVRVIVTGGFVFVGAGFVFKAVDAGRGRN